MKNNFIHTKNDNKKTLIIYLCCLIPLVLYGIYKNGILLYNKAYINFLEIFKPLYLILIGVVINRGLEFLLNKNKKFDFTDLNVVILALFMMPSVNLLLYTIILAISLLIVKIVSKRFSFNSISLIVLVMSLGMLVLGKYSYSNLAESNNLYAYNLMDLIWGRNVGGIASSSILIGVIIYGVLAVFANYKKTIPMLSYLMYVICILIIMFFIKTFDYNSLFNSTVILGFILVSTDTLTTPYTFVGMLIYAIILGALTAVLTIFLPFEGVFISTLLLSVVSPFINNFLLF